MRVETASIPDVLVVTLDVYRDTRGFLVETFVEERCREAGIRCAFVQDNCSFSRSGVLRGLHFQAGGAAQDKLVTAMSGAIFDVALDIRPGSPTFGRFATTILRASEGRQVFVPAGFAHGFLALEESLVVYKCSTPYSPPDERGVAWDDPDLSIPWPIARPLVSAKDARWPRLRDIPPGDLPLVGIPRGRP